MFQNTVQRTGREIVAGLSWNGNAANLARVLELTMASTRRDQIPTIGLQQPEHFADLHGMRMAGAVARIMEPIPPDLKPREPDVFVFRTVSVMTLNVRAQRQARAQLSTVAATMGSASSVRLPEEEIPP